MDEQTDQTEGIGGAFWLVICLLILAGVVAVGGVAVGGGL